MGLEAIAIICLILKKLVFIQSFKERLRLGAQTGRPSFAGITKDKEVVDVHHELPS